MLLGVGMVFRARDQQSLALYAQRLGHPPKRPMRFGTLYRVLCGGRGGVSIASRYENLGMHAAEDRVPNAPGSRVQFVEARARKPLAARDIASFGPKRAFESQAAGVVTRKAILAGLLLEKSNRSF